ncbi:MAG: glycosyl hydrolase 108 family protein, partial [Kiloniellaceae bacterium]
LETGRIAAVAEEEARRLQAEDPKARGGFWVRDRRNTGLIYVVPNPDPADAEGELIFGGEGDDIVIGQASTPLSPPPPKPAAPPQPSRAPASPTQPSQTATIPPRVSKLPADAYGLFLLYRQRLEFFEGGLANRPPHEDPGGETNQGVSQVLLDALHKNKAGKYGHYPIETRHLSDDQIETILRKEIFDPLHTWKVAQIPDLLTLAPELVEQIFDIGVLHGVGFAGHIVQEALFEVMGIDLRVMKNGKLDYDGVIGPATRNAVAQAVAAGKIVEVNNLIVDKRIAELTTKGHKVDNPGWFPRSESFRIAPAVSPGQPGTP